MGQARQRGLVCVQVAAVGVGLLGVTAQAWEDPAPAYRTYERPWRVYEPDKHTGGLFHLEHSVDAELDRMADELGSLDFGDGGGGALGGLDATDSGGGAPVPEGGAKIADSSWRWRPRSSGATKTVATAAGWSFRAAKR